MCDAQVPQTPCLLCPPAPPPSLKVLRSFASTVAHRLAVVDVSDSKRITGIITQVRAHCVRDCDCVCAQYAHV